MTNKLKQILFEYLAATYPCGIICEVPFNKKEQKLQGIIGTDLNDIRLIFEKDGDLLCECYLSEVKPYIRPMSSMTKEELKEFVSFTSQSMHRFICESTNTDHWYNAYEEEDWLNMHKFDYRGLIKMGLALPAPDGMYI